MYPMNAAPSILYRPSLPQLSMKSTSFPASSLVGDDCNNRNDSSPISVPAVGNRHHAKYMPPSLRSQEKQGNPPRFP